MKWPMAAEAPSKRDQSSCGALAHRGDQHIVDGGLVGRGEVRLQRHAGRGRHVGHGLDELAQVAFEIGVQLDDPDQRLERVLVVDRAGDTDGLVRRSEMRVPADLRRDVAAQSGHARNVAALGGLGQLPPDMGLALPLGRNAAAFHHHGGRAEVALEMGPRGGDVAGVEVDDHGLHLLDIGGPGLTGLRDGAGDDIDRRALARGPIREGHHLVGRGRIRLDPDVVRPAVEALTLVDEAADRDQPVGVAEDHLHELRDLRGVRLVAEHVDLRRGVVEVAPRVEMDEILGRRRRRVIVVIGGHGGVLGHCGRVGWVFGRISHAGRLQQRSAHGQNRHSKKSRLAAMRGSSSPASVARRIRTPRSDMRCARSASKGTSSWCSSAVSLLIAVKSAGLAEMPGTVASM